MAKISISQAAQLLGVSKDTIRRKIKAKEVEAEKIDGPYGKQWAIEEDSLAKSTEIVDVVPIQKNLTTGEVEKLFRKVLEEQTEEIKKLRGEISELRKEISESKQLSTSDPKEEKEGKWWKFW